MLLFLSNLSVRGMELRMQREKDPSELAADTIMDKVIFFAPFYEHMVESYKAEFYLKGRLEVVKRNYMMRWIPSMYPFRKGPKEYLMETYSDLHYRAPEIYEQKLKASMGTAPELWDMGGLLPQYFRVNVYSSSLLLDKLISPLATNAKKYYTFRMDSVMSDGPNRNYRIRFFPRNKSYQLVGGYLVVSAEVWSIREMRFSGRTEIAGIENRVLMGEVGQEDEFLPVGYEAELDFRFVRNRVKAQYTAHLHYNEVKTSEDEVQQLQQKKKQKNKNRYDLSDSFTLRTDDELENRDTVYFNQVRPLPLLPHEQALYRDFYAQRDTAALQVALLPKKTRLFWEQVERALLDKHTIRMADVGSVRFSPLLNPSMLSYSGGDFSYKHVMHYRQLFKGDRLLSVMPHFGYNFGEHEFYWQLLADYEYWPEKRAKFRLEFGKGERISTLRVRDELEKLFGDVFNPNYIHLDEFKNYYLNFLHTWEMVNGLTLDVGFSLHQRSEINRTRFVQQQGNVWLDPSMLSRFRHSYNSLAPRIRVTWTPGQYYYMSGARKINLDRSKYPSVSVDYERGIKRLISNGCNYERIEVDMQHRVRLGLMRSLCWRFGWGSFTNKEDLFFTDFVNWWRTSLPVGWSDDMGGRFQLLDGYWYNSSKDYVRGHITYDAPFLLLPRLRKYTQHVLNERLYLNALNVPGLHPYFEVGYGIHTHIFDLGLFASFANWEYQKMGFKFTFELFN